MGVVVVVSATLLVISGSVDAEHRTENSGVPLNLLSKFPSYFKLEMQIQSLFYGLLHVGSGRSEGWLGSKINSNCDIPQNRFQTETDFKFKL